MKTQALIVAAAFVMFAGCASQKQDDSAAASNNNGNSATDDGRGIPTAPGTGTGTGTDPTTTGYPSGSTSSLVLNGSALSRMFYNSQPTNATNPRINIDLSSSTEAVIVSYVQSGVLKEAAFGTQHPNVSSLSDSSYNGWVGSVWKGFFQDAYGAIVLVLDKSMNQSDGTATMILGGSIWFQNFQQSVYQNPAQGNQQMCWKITAGPYDCRSFLVANPSGNAYNKVKVDMSSALYPTTYGPNKTTAYEKLGDFGGVNRTSAGIN